MHSRRATLTTPTPAPDVASTTKTGRTGNGHGARGRIDWAAAKAFYLADRTRSFTDVAKQFGVSGMSVGRHARREGWADERQALVDQANAQTSATVLKSLEQRNRETLEIVDLARGKMRVQLADPEFRLSGEGFTSIAKLEQLLEGQATDRVAVGEVTRVLVLVGRGFDELLQRVLDETLANGKRKLVLDRFRSEAGEVLELAAGGLVAQEAA